MARVHRWDLLHPDEVVRFFPGLITTAGHADLPLELLEQAVAAGWRRVLARARATSTRRDETQEAAWFPAQGPLRAAVDWLLGERPEAEIAGEDGAIPALEALLARRRAGQRVPYTEPLALTLAFHAGVHPAYLWDEALPLHEVATAIGWIGVLARGRRALLPRDIAATLADGIALGANATGRCRDHRFGLCGLDAPQWGLLGRAASRCLAGKRDLVRLTPAMRRARAETADRTGPALAAGVSHR